MRAKLGNFDQLLRMLTFMLETWWLFKIRFSESARRHNAEIRRNVDQDWS